VHDNLVYDNTAGILVFVLPGKVQKEGKRTRVFRNWSLRNNRPNFGDPESIVGQLPYGLGLLIAGADDTVVENNWIKNNDTAGIALVRLAPDQAAKDPELDPLAERNRILFNRVSQNGLHPHAVGTEGYGGGADLVWDGTGADNCADLPDHATTAGSPLAACIDLGSDTGAAAGEAALSSSRAPVVAPLFGAASSDGQVVPGVTAGQIEGPVVRIRAMRFEPRHLEIEAGQTVTWLNEDAVTHTVTSGEGTVPTSAPLASPFLARGAAYRYTFDSPGRYEYLCLPHFDQAPMRGATVRVKERS
jgi:plastocyanin